MKKANLLVVFLFLLSCSPSGRHTVDVVNKLDTIDIDFKIANDSCAFVSKGYTEKYGYVISNFYEEVDFSILDFSGSGSKDTLTIFSPKNRIPVNHICDAEKDADRLLIILTGGKKFLFKNVIRNELGIATLGTEHIASHEGGFTLEYHLGQACFFDYAIDIKCSEGKFFISNIHLRQGCPRDETRVREYHFEGNEFPLTSYKRSLIDSLRKENKM